MTIRQYKKLARANAQSQGTSYQAELNAIAEGAGYDSWGPFQKFLAAGGVPLALGNEQDEEIADILDALRFAIGKKDRHLVIRRGGDAKAERAVMKRLRSAIEELSQLTETYRFLDGLTHKEVAMANYESRTLVAGSVGQPSMIHNGNCVVQDPEETLSYANAMATRSGRMVVENSFHPREVSTFGPKGTDQTTVRKKSQLRFLPKSGTPAQLREKWEMPLEERPSELSDFSFIPSFNPLGNDQLRYQDWDDVHQTANAISRTLILGDDYFAVESRKALSGLIILHVDEAWKISNEPSLPGVEDMLKDILRSASVRWETGHDNNANILREEIEARCLGMAEEDQIAKVTNLLFRINIAMPNERSGILGKVDQALLMFRNPHIRKLTI